MVHHSIAWKLQNASLATSVTAYVYFPLDVHANGSTLIVMRIFGRKANQHSASIAGPDVPPELQPYYGRPSLAVRLRRIGLFVLPVVAALALIVALIAGGMWLKNRADENSHKVATSQSTPKSSAGSSQQNSTPQSSNNSQNQPSGTQPPNSSTDNTNSVSGSNSSNSSASQQSENASTDAQTPSASNIPSTGPDSGIYLVAFAAAIAGAAASYIRQLKTVRR